MDASIAATGALPHESTILTLWLTCASMALGAYIPGAVALLLPIRQTEGHLSHTVSAGLLLGAGLCVVLPEGFFSLLEAQATIPESQHVPKWLPGAVLLAGFLLMAALDTFLCSSHSHSHGPSAMRRQPSASIIAAPSDHAAHHHHASAPHDSMAAQWQQQQTDDHRGHMVHVNHSLDLTPSMQFMRTAAYTPPPCCTEHTVHARLLDPDPEQPQSLIYEERITGIDDEHDAPMLHAHNGSRVSAVPRRHELVKKPSGACGAHGTHAPHGGPSSSNQALLGLVLHSAADGLAVGAAALSNSLVVSLTVAASIMVHKVPVAYGLASFLRASGLTPRAAHAGLLYFVSAAPLMALATFYGLGHITWVTEPQVVSLVLLASGGTVLHAGAVHVLPGAGKSLLDLLVMSLASLVPLMVLIFMKEHA